MGLWKNGMKIFWNQKHGDLLQGLEIQTVTAKIEINTLKFQRGAFIMWFGYIKYIPLYYRHKRWYKSYSAFVYKLKILNWLPCEQLWN